MSEGVPARQAKDYKIPTKHNGIIGYCYGKNEKGKTEWACFNGTSYQSWWDNKMIYNNKLFNINPTGGRGYVKAPAVSIDEYSEKSYRNLEI